MKSSSQLKKMYFLFGLIVLCAVGLTGCKKAPQDDVDIKVMRFDGVRGHRYTEIFLIGGNPITKNLVGGVYNTVGLNDTAGTGDTCPQEILNKVGIETLKKEYNLLSAYKNGPRLWTLDWLEVKVGKDGTSMA